MSSRKSTIIVKPASLKKYGPELYERRPWTCTIKNKELPISNKEFLYNSEELVLNVLNYLKNNPYSFVVLRNKKLIKEGVILKTTLDTLVEEHNSALKEYNLVLKLSKGKRHRRLKKIKDFLKEMEKGK